MDELIKQYEHGQISKEELEAGLKDFLATTDTAAPELVTYKRPEMLAKILAPKATPVRTIPAYRKWLVRAAAAAILILVAFGGWLLFEDKKEPGVVPTAQIIVPASNKAVLVTADGKRIVLDSGMQRVGNARILNGVVSYEKTSIAQLNTLETPKGGLFQVVLPDGTHVWLNAATKLTYPTVFTTALREVALDGEAYFEVSKDAAHPFVVKTRTDKIEVLGTHFNINSYAEEGDVRTTLSEGKVKIAAAILAPGEQYRNGTITKADLGEVLAWKNGKFQFGGADLRAIMRQIGRWYDVDVKYAGKPAEVQLMGTMSRRSTVNQLLEILEETGKVKFKLEGRTIEVRSVE